MKKCTHCKTEKTFECFPYNKKTSDKLGSWCKDCVKIAQKADYRKNKTARDAKTLKWQRANPTSVRSYRLGKYGIDEQQYQDLLKAQENCCKICNTHQKDLKNILVVDHDHRTGRVRGLLCKQCNVAIGLLKDSVQNLYNAIDYLDKKD